MKTAPLVALALLGSAAAAGAAHAGGSVKLQNFGAGEARQGEARQKEAAPLEAFFSASPGQPGRSGFNPVLGADENQMREYLERIRGPVNSCGAPCKERVYHTLPYDPDDERVPDMDFGPAPALSDADKQPPEVTAEAGSGKTSEAVSP